MAALQKKVCMVGAFAVGKTSLVQRFVRGIFSEKYLTTVGVKIDKASVETPTAAVSLILWDLAGEDSLHSFNLNFLTGASGLIFVIDSTRRNTLDSALQLRERIEATFCAVPAIAFLNKIDLPEQAELTADDLARLAAAFPHHLRSSALSGEGVAEGFRRLASEMVAAGERRLERPRPTST